MHPCEQRKTVVSWYYMLYVLDYSSLNYAFVVHEWSISRWNFLGRSWCVSNNLQKIVIILVPKPYSSIENNLLQKWPETDVNFSYTPLAQNVASTSEWRGDRLSLAFLVSIKPLNPSRILYPIAAMGRSIRSICFRPLITY